jgi:UDP-N-acetylmuramyl tripeptide synthase
MYLRSLAALWAGKAVHAGLRVAGRGGTVLPGLVAQRLDSDLARRLTARLPHGVVLLAGTNGKTTTARMLALALECAGLRVVHNREGANLLSGVSSRLVQAASLSGRLAADVAVMEIDEAAFPQAVRALAPRTVVLHNLFRDQLDRYGEVDAIARRWWEALGALPRSAVAVINADDPRLFALARALPSGARVLFYSVRDPRHSLERLPHAVDSANCPCCGNPLAYEQLYLSHLGTYRCVQCSFAAPQPQVVARWIELDGIDGVALAIEHGGETVPLRLNVPGLYNAYNALAAVSAALACGIALTQATAALQGFRAAFGRAERLEHLDRQVAIFLVKNPVGFNEVLRTLFPPGTDLQTAPGARLLIAINDLDADGRDVSWLWDVDFEALPERVEWVTVSGIRAHDMALRLKYAGLPLERVHLELDLERALDYALEHTPPGKLLCILPTYTAMLALRRILARRGVVGHVLSG